MSTALNIKPATDISPMLINLSYQKPKHTNNLTQLLEEQLQNIRLYTLPKWWL